MNGQFHVDPEILSPWVKRGQEVIWSENNPNHNDKIKIFEVLEKFHPKKFWKFHPWTLITISHIFIIIFLRWQNFCWINFETYNTQKCRSCFEIAISNQNRCGQDTKGDTVEVTIKQRNCFNILWTKSHSWRHQIVRMTSENEKVYV